ncbi:MAG: hypothetical protein Q8Q15_02565 [bacterium]|nr:hypothetical protein [bacterium]
MKKFFSTILTILTLLTIPLFFPSPSFAAIKKSGDIELITDEPLFPSTIAWYPGLRVEKSIQVKNRGTGTKKVEIEAMSELVTKNLADVLQFEVKEGTKTLYGSPSKTLKNFFDAQTLELSEVWVNDDGRAFSLIVTMPDTAGNEYQGGKVSFDLRVGFPGGANSSVIISSNTTTSTVTPTVLSASAPSGQTISLVLGESVSPTPVISPTGVISGENPSSQNEQTGNILKIILWLLAAGVIILALILWKFFSRQK